ncbi:intermembrane phospholipid transport protein YdbH family protein [Stutzerimonas tarimensis]|uniref:YdbH domain-containing protein n=1 Tax=Stutzerimonas tarimensis TaxID=1507735 RepID=A0ABV7T342_9GAMM
MLYSLLLVTVVLVTAAALVTGYIQAQWQTIRHEHGIETLTWQGLRLSARGVHLEHAQLSQRTRAGDHLEVELTGGRLAWKRLLAPWPAQRLTIEQLVVSWTPGTDSLVDDESTSLPNPGQLEAWLRQTPHRMDIASLHLALPCLGETCHEQGSLSWSRPGDSAYPAHLQLSLERGEHQMRLSASADDPGDHLEVLLQLSLDNEPRLHSRHQLDTAGDVLSWQGTLAMGNLPEAPWLLEWLGRWVDFDVSTVPTAPEAMRLGVSWSVELPEERLQQASGELRASLALPAPWPVPGIGLLAGELDLALTGAAGAWTPTGLTGDLLLQPNPNILQALPPELRPSSIRLQASPSPHPSSDQRLSLQMEALARGSSQIELRSDRLLLRALPFSLAFDDANLSLQAPGLLMSPARLDKLEVRARLRGQVDGSKLDLSALPGARLSIAEMAMDSLDLTAQGLQTQLAGLRLVADWQQESWQLQGPAQLSTATLGHPQLQGLSWHWQGQLNAQSTGLDLDGRLGNEAGLGASLLFAQRSAGDTRMELRLDEIFLLAGNPLARSLTAWPATLELNGGRLQAQGQLQLPVNGPLRASGRFSGKGLAGIFDRVEFDGLAAEIDLSVAGERLEAAVTHLEVAQMNPGFSFGPLRFQGRYQAPLEEPAQGRLSWGLARLQVLGGVVTITPGELDLKTWSPAQQLTLRGLDLRELFAAYPAQGLTGTGIIDGQFDLQRSAAGFVIEQGSLAAREPGVLRFDSPQIQALGRTNPAMQFVTEALENFHYQLLTGDIRYDENGLLQLGLRLHGTNPDLERGRPINFNINLEEDIPALLTSLQLSDRVSEIIQRRVQERLGSGAAPVRP